MTSLQHIAFFVGRQGIEQRGPGADGAPAGVERRTNASRVFSMTA